jgi:hypothetical protein
MLLTSKCQKAILLPTHPEFLHPDLLPPVPLIVAMVSLKHVSNAALTADEY